MVAEEGMAGADGRAEREEGTCAGMGCNETGGVREEQVRRGTWFDTWRTCAQTVTKVMDVSYTTI